MHVQFVWKGAPGVFEGKKLTYQNKWSLEPRSWSEAQSRAKDLEKRLKDFAEGKVLPKGTTVEAALQEWYKFRDQDGLGNTKAKQMGGKLVEWCERNNILLLTVFRSFINECPSNNFNTLFVRWRKRPLSNPGNLPFEADAAHGASDDFCHSHSEYLRQAGCRSRERDEQRFRLEEFARFGEASVPGLQVALEAFHRTGNWKETAMIFSRPRCDAIQRRARQQGNALAAKVRFISLNTCNIIDSDI